jgi:radical SAM protein with 4Fe4S-binding SPASM domain
MAEKNESVRIEKSGRFIFSKNFEENIIRTRVQNLVEVSVNNHEKFSAYSDVDQKILQTLNTTIQVSNLSESSHLNFFDEKKFVLSRQEIEWIIRAPDCDIVNYLIYRYKFRNWPRSKTLSDFPIHLLIEPTSICNIRCVMCFQVDKSFAQKDYMGRMPMEMFSKVIEEASLNSCKAITLASRGEPTLHKDLPLMLELISQKNFLDIKLNTNATKLTEDLCRAILSFGVSELVYSVDAGTKDTYESIRVGGKFNDVVQNIDTFNEIRRAEFPDSRTVTRISGVKVNDSQDISQMIDFWSERVDEVTIKPAIPRWDSYNNDLTFRLEPCELLWERSYVWYDGKINPCDFDYKSYLSVGNVETTSIKEAWLGKGYTKLREAHSAARRGKITPCDRCPM